MMIAILLLIIISGWQIYRTLTPVADSWQGYQQQAAMRQKLLMGIKADFGYGGMIHNFKNYVLRGQAKYLERISNNYSSVNGALTQYSQLDGLTSQEQAALTAIRQTAKTYYDNSQLIKQLLSDGKNAEGIDTVVKISDGPAFDAFKVLDQQYRKMTTEFGDQINGAISSAKVTMISALVTLAVVIIAVLLWLYYSIVPPLRLLNRTMDDIAQGDGDLRVRLDQTRHDEFGSLASAFNTFIIKIHNIIVEQRSVIKKIANSANDLQDITNSSNEAIQSQLSHTEQLASAVTQMSATVDDIAKNATIATDSTAQADKTASQGQTAVSGTVNQIQNIHQHLAQASNVINEVNNTSSQVGQVLSVISEIADQTNLLALNAAIEAARAGESGRGFAVVADEVRGLAQRTAVSLTDIQKIIAQLQSSASEAVNSMEKGVKEVATGSAIAQEAGHSIINIVKEIGTIHDMNIQIATATEEQSAVATEMNKNVHHISSMSSSIFTGSQQIAEHSVNLANMTTQLEDLVGSFKTA